LKTLDNSLAHDGKTKNQVFLAFCDMAAFCTGKTKVEGTGGTSGVQWNWIEVV